MSEPHGSKTDNYMKGMGNNELLRTVRSLIRKRSDRAVNHKNTDQRQAKYNSPNDPVTLKIIIRPRLDPEYHRYACFIFVMHLCRSPIESKPVRPGSLSFLCCNSPACLSAANTDRIRLAHVEKRTTTSIFAGESRFQRPQRRKRPPIHWSAAASR